MLFAATLCIATMHQSVHFLQRRKWLWDNFLVSSKEMPPVSTWQDLDEWRADMYQVPEVRCTRLQYKLTELVLWPLLNSDPFAAMSAHVGN